MVPAGAEPRRSIQTALRVEGRERLVLLLSTNIPAVVAEEVGVAAPLAVQVPRGR